MGVIQATNNQGNPTSASFTSLPSAGNSVIVVAQSGSTSPSELSTTCTDNQGNTYVKVAQGPSAAGYLGVTEIWWCQSIGTPSGTFTVTWSLYEAPYNSGVLGLIEYSGLTSVDQSGDYDGGDPIGTSATVSGSTNNSSANDFVVCSLYIDYASPSNSPTNPPNTGYTSFIDYSGNRAYSAGYKTVSAIETSSASWSWSNAASCGAAIASFEIASSGASGAATITETSDTAAGVGTTGNGGVAAITEGSDTVSATGATATAGTAAIVEGSDTVNAAGTAGTSGTAAITEGHDAVSGVGTAAAVGVAAITEGPDTAAGVGATSTAGAAAITESADTVAGVGIAGYGGAAGITEGSDITAAVGAASTQGSAAITESADTVAGVGVAFTSGNAAITEGHDSVAGVGAAGAVGVASITEGSDSVAAVGVSSTAGSAAITESADIVASVGVASTSGAAAITEGHDAAAGAGTAGYGGAAGITEGSDLAIGVGATATTGAAGITEGSDLAIGVGATATTGAAAITEGSDITVGVGGIAGAGVASIAEGSDTVAGVGLVSAPAAPIHYPPPPRVFPYEGAFASRVLAYNLETLAPFRSVMTRPGGAVSNSPGTIQGRFGWYNDATRQVNNTRVAATDTIGIVVPYRSMSPNGGVVGGPRGLAGPQASYTWEFWDDTTPPNGVLRVRPGLGVTLGASGNFWLRFVGGAIVGNPVYASLVDGSAISGIMTNAELTPWYVCTVARPGGLAIVSRTAVFAP